MRRIIAIIMCLIMLMSVVSCRNSGIENTTELFTSGDITDMTSQISIDTTEPDDYDSMTDTLFHIVILGQSLSVGCATGSCLEACVSSQAYMFNNGVRTQDLGYLFGITRDQYDANSDGCDNILYSRLTHLREIGGSGNASTKWQSASPVEFETPATGIAEGLYNAYRAEGYDDIPYKILVSAPGIGGTDIDRFGTSTDIYRRAKKDIQNGKRLAEKQGLKYKVLAFVWMQGENNAYSAIDNYCMQLRGIKSIYTEMAKNVTGQTIDPEFITYQTAMVSDAYNPTTQNAILAQFNAANIEKSNIAMSAPCYQFKLAGDNLHLTNVSSRNIGMLIGQTLYEKIHGEYTLFRPENVEVNGKTAVIEFSFPIEFNKNGLLASRDYAGAVANNGFYCFGADGKVLDTNMTLSDDGKTITINCSSDIHDITYGYDLSQSSTKSYTCGGTVCKTTKVKGYNNSDLQLYMPVQDIYRSK